MATTRAEQVYGEIVGETGYVEQILQYKLDKYEIEELIGLLQDRVDELDKQDEEKYVVEDYEEPYDPAEDNTRAAFDNMMHKSEWDGFLKTCKSI